MTINHKLLDMKLKDLIFVCKQTGNFKKLAVVGFTLISNIIDEICLKLGTRPRNKEKGETILEYLYMVNEVFEKNLNIHIFQDDIVDTIKEVEILFLRNRGDLSVDYIRKILNTYYDLRKVGVPNVYKNVSGDSYFDDTKLHMFNIFSSGSKVRRDRSSKFKPLLLHKISQQERIIQKKLNLRLGQDDLEKAIVLKNIKNNLDHNGRLSMQGSLKNYIDYHQNNNSIIKFVFIGIALLPLFLGIVIITEIFLYPLTLVPLNNLLLILLGVVVVIILLFKNLFQKR
ncbi:MAG: hypothetical protein ACFFA0_05210 [Promethearchaeota archaeon]